MKRRNTPIEEDEELFYDSEEMMQTMFDEDCDPDEDMSGESIFGDWNYVIAYRLRICLSIIGGRHFQNRCINRII